MSVGGTSTMLYRFLPLALLCALLLAPAAPLHAVPATTTGLRVVRSDATGVVLELNTPAYELRRTASVVQLLVPGYEQRAIGNAPALPYANATIALPTPAAPTAQLIADESVRLTLPALLAATPAFAPASAAMGARVLADGAPQPRAAPDPAQPVVVGSVALMRGKPFVSVSLFPFQQIDRNRVVWHRHLRVELRFAATARA
ncbi:MAG: hypothetical protein H7Y32_18800, partial [Chloroflexales bacterium]|nr:hypothetical protein [Chloroflexales bacterium]